MPCCVRRSTYLFLPVVQRTQQQDDVRNVAALHRVGRVHVKGRRVCAQLVKRACESQIDERLGVRLDDWVSKGDVLPSSRTLT